MKKKPHKLPCELHDPKLDSPRCGLPLDLSDEPLRLQTEQVLPQPGEWNGTETAGLE